MNNESRKFWSGIGRKHGLEDINQKIKQNEQLFEPETGVTEEQKEAYTEGYYSVFAEAATDDLLPQGIPMKVE